MPIRRPAAAAAPLLLVLAAAGCTEQEFNVQNIPPPAGDLTLSGRVCHPITQTWLPDALVYTNLYDANDIVYDSRSDYTDEDGYFLLEGLVADKDYEIYTQLGQDIIDKYIVSLGRENATVPAPACAAPVELNVAVITGAYDDLEPILSAIGVTGTRVIDGQSGSEITDFLTDPVAMAEYDLLFFDGGHREDGVVYGSGPVSSILGNLQTYVANGGVVFASDWAYDVVEQTWPAEIDFYGDDTVPDAAQVGEAGVVSADIVDAELASAIQLDKVDITYDLPVWPLVDSVAGDVDVYLRGTAPWRHGLDVGEVTDSPLLVGFDAGAGRVLFTTYRNSVNNNQAMLGVLISIVDAVGGG